MYKFAIFGLFVAAAVALPTQDVKQTGALDCLQEEELFSCLLVKASTALRRAARSSNIDIVEGITFVRDIPSEYLMVEWYWSYFWSVGLGLDWTLKRPPEPLASLFGTVLETHLTLLKFLPVTIDS